MGGIGLNITEGYADIALLPSAGGLRKARPLPGIDMEATEAAGDIVANQYMSWGSSLRDCRRVVLLINTTIRPEMLPDFFEMRRTDMHCRRLCPSGRSAHPVQCAFSRVLPRHLRRL
jgi:hypothetical protein